MVQNKFTETDLKRKVFCNRTLNLKSIKDLVAQAIEELPEKQRLVLSLYYYEDLNLKEIGQVLRVTESRVSQLHAQAVSRLRGKLATHFDLAAA